MIPPTPPVVKNFPTKPTAPKVAPPPPNCTNATLFLVLAPPALNRTVLRTKIAPTVIATLKAPDLGHATAPLVLKKTNAKPIVV